MSRSPEIGAPMPMPLFVPFPVAMIGDFEHGDGVELVFQGNQLVVNGSFGEAQVTFGVDICLLLDALGKYHKQTGS